MIGIYKITDKISGKSYVGQSIHIFTRWSEHARNIKKEKELNGVPLELENLTFEILELCSVEELDDKEIYWIKYYDSYNNGFNKTSGGQRKRGEEKAHKTSSPRIIEKSPLVIGEDKHFHNLEDYIRKLRPEPNKGYWCYSPLIAENKNIVKLANQLGFNAIELHSSNNEEFPMDDEQIRVANTIITTGMVPIDYDFVVVTNAFEKRIKVQDTRFNQLIINSIGLVAREQSYGLACHYQRILKVPFPPIPEKYMNKLLDLKACRELANELRVHIRDITNSGKIMTWNAIKDCLEDYGYSYEVKKKEIGGKHKTCYIITGSWKEK